jgi:hypothetical protein
MGSVGLGDRVDFDDAVDSAAELGRVLFDKLQVIKPTKAAVELTLGFTVEAGKWFANAGVIGEWRRARLRFGCGPRLRLTGLGVEALPGLARSA